MSQIRYETKGNTESEGKLRIYFAALPQDFRRYYEQVRNDLLNTVDCAVFYHDPDEAIDDFGQLELDLAGMRVIAIVITKEVLENEHPLIEACLRCAKEKSAALLPLLADASVKKYDDLYYKKFGELQYRVLPESFERNREHDLFLEKLKIFLDTYVISPETVDRIRTNFNLTVFVSYRRSDQKTVCNVLLPEAHILEPQYGAAIWYDDFLTPGENFNQTIMSALERCDIFLMALSPAMLEEENYVITTEYPAAVRLKKPILAVEIEAVDHEKIREVFGDEVADPICMIPPEGYVELSGRGWSTGEEWKEMDRREQAEGGRFSKGKKEFRSRLFRMFSEVARGKRLKESREFYYYLGLAFFYGIDVPRELSAAKKFMGNAASAGCLPALEWLAERDVTWCASLRDRCRELYDRDRDPAIAVKLLDAAKQDMRYRINQVLEKPAEIREAYRDLLKTATELKKVCPEKAEECIFDAELGLIECDYQDGKILTASRDARRLLKNAEKHSSDKIAMRRQVRVLALLGDIYSRAVISDKAPVYVDKALEIAEHHPLFSDNDKYADYRYNNGLSALPEDEEYARCCCRVYLRAAELLYEDGRRQAALFRCETAVSMAENFYEAHSTPENRLLLTDCYIVHARLIGTQNVKLMFEIAQRAYRIIKNPLEEQNISVKRRIRQSVVHGLIALASPDSDFRMRGNRNDMIEKAQEVAERTGSSPESIKLLFDAYVTAEKIDRQIKDDFYRSRTDFRAEWLRIGAMLAKKHSWLLSDEDREMIYDTVRGRR